jgi:hypothetical protein
MQPLQPWQAALEALGERAGLEVLLCSPGRYWNAAQAVRMLLPENIEACTEICRRYRIRCDVRELWNMQRLLLRISLP